MGKETITHSCGHEQVHQLYGKHSDRDRKAEWLSRQLCTDCWRQEKDNEPITAKGSLIMDMTTDGDPVYQIAITGGTKKRKEDIKALGYSWGYPRGGALDLFSSKSPSQAWYKLIPLTIIDGDISTDNLKADLKKVYRVADKVVEKPIDPITLELITKRTRAKIQQDKEIANIQKPDRPKCYPAGRWNGKIYGKEKYGYRVYIDGDETQITKEEKESIQTYLTAQAQYQQKIKDIKSGKK